jgi:hypothetical protein
MAMLCRARLLIAILPFHRWRASLGGTVSHKDAEGDSATSRRDASRLARVVGRAADRLPFETKCLPRAMTLSWLLTRRRIPHAIVFAVRTAPARGSADSLHAWVEVDGAIVMGDLPGPWIETLRLGS